MSRTHNPGQYAILLLLRAYKLMVSPVLTFLFTPLGCGCRFSPTCSAFAAEAISTHGVMLGSWLAIRRLLRCQPWGGSGYDPVPPDARCSKQSCAIPHHTR